MMFPVQPSVRCIVSALLPCSCKTAVRDDVHPSILTGAPQDLHLVVSISSSLAAFNGRGSFKKQFKQRLIFHGSVAAQPLNHLNISFCETPHSTMFDRSV